MKELKCPKCGNIFTVDEADYAQLLNQVKNSEFEAELTRRLHELEQTQKARLEAERQAEQARAEADKARMLAEQQLNIQKKEAEIAALQAQIQQAEQRQELAIAQIRQKATESYMGKEKELAALRSQMESEIKALQDQVAYYKDLKIKLSTKMVGETLEQHCYNEFTRISPLFPYAEFHKDNEVIEGSKGDFVFRDSSEDGVEYVSIMFEMKNENDETATKHKNQDFFAKLDQDRKKKGCEYAVLVSMLEPENELYNNGIVAATQNDKGERFDKMYVIRPQFFVPLITLLCQANRKSLDAKRELTLIKQKQVDVTRFEEKLMTFQDSFNKHVQSAHTNYEKAIKSIDNIIRGLEAVKITLGTSANQLRLANNEALELTIRKLTYGNPTMKALFEEANQDNQDNTPE